MGATHAQAGESGGHPEQAVRNYRAQPSGGGGGSPRKLQRAHLVHSMQERKGGNPQTRRKTKGHPPSIVRSQSTACRIGGRGGGPPTKRGGEPLNQERRTFMRGLIPEMGGSPQNLQRPPTAG